MSGDGSEEGSTAGASVAEGSAYHHQQQQQQQQMQASGAFEPDSIDDLRQRLQAQCEVNAELKKMLVASFGSDVAYRFDRLAWDRSQFKQRSETLEDRLTKDQEALDEALINSDVWRTKFTASKVLIGELNAWKASAQHRQAAMESAVEQLLAERNALQEHVLACHRILRKGTQSTVKPEDSFTILQLAELNLAMAHSLATPSSTHPAPATSNTNTTTTTNTTNTPTPQSHPPELSKKDSLPNVTSAQVVRTTAEAFATHVLSVSHAHPLKRQLSATVETAFRSPVPLPHFIPRCCQGEIHHL